MIPRPDADAAPIIVVGYDGSDAANRALVRAAQLALPSRGRVTVVAAAPLLVHFGEAPVGRGEMPQPDAILAEAAERLRRLGIESEGIAVPLEPADALIETARDLDAEILVVGTRGRGRAARTALGSVSTAVLHHAPCDVLIVRPASSGQEEGAGTDWPRAVLVGCDGSPWARQALERAMGLVRPGGAVKVVFAIAPRARRARVTPVSAAVQEMRDLAAAREVSVCSLEQEGDPAAVIIEAARACNADLVVVGSRSRGPAARLILGSVSTAVVHRAAQDVLVVRRRRYGGRSDGVPAAVATRGRSAAKRGGRARPAPPP
jgi:nucleotide-binding universal stress UspA family protein